MEVPLAGHLRTGGRTPHLHAMSLWTVDASTSSPADVFLSVAWKSCPMWSSSSCSVVIGAEVVSLSISGHACHDVSVLLTTVRVQASETIFERFWNSPVERGTDLALYRIHCKDISTTTKCIRFPTLRVFILSHSMRRCQGQEQNAAWYVACRESRLVISDALIRQRNACTFCWP